MPGVRYIIPLALAKSEGEQALYFKINTLPQAQMDTASAVPKISIPNREQRITCLS